MPSRCASVACRRVWRTMPWRASTSSTARCAVDAAVTMLRVYCSWPGRVGDDELAPRGREVAVRDVDRDALLALGGEAVGEEREIERLPAPLRRALDRGELVGEDRLGVVEQAADQRALAVVDAAGGEEPQHAVSSTVA